MPTNQNEKDLFSFLISKSVFSQSFHLILLSFTNGRLQSKLVKHWETLEPLANRIKKANFINTLAELIQRTQCELDSNTQHYSKKPRNTKAFKYSVHKF